MNYNWNNTNSMQQPPQPKQPLLPHPNTQQQAPGAYPWHEQGQNIGSEGYWGAVGYQSGSGDAPVSSLGGLVDKAMDTPRSKALAATISNWQMLLFNTPYSDPVTTLTSSFYQSLYSQVPDLELSYTESFLWGVEHYSFFTGVLSVNQTHRGEIVDTVFLARGMDQYTEGAKYDTYEKAYELLMNTDVNQMLNQVDCGRQPLLEEIQKLYSQDRPGFLALINGQQRGMKRPAGFGAIPPAPGAPGFGAGPMMKRGRLEPLMGDGFNGAPGGSRPNMIPYTKFLSDVVCNKFDPLPDKVKKMMELLKAEGITKLHIVPKIDQFAHKCAIDIMNVYRFSERPYPGHERKTPVYVQIYLDGVLVIAGQPKVDRRLASINAYNYLTNLLCTNIAQVSKGKGYWSPNMAYDEDVLEVETKWQSGENTAMHNSNLVNMTQMMQQQPNLKLSWEKMIITEHEADQVEGGNAFKSLELSATRNLMLLEVETIFDPYKGQYTCILSMQGTILIERKHHTKNGAKKICSDTIMDRFKNSNDYVYVYKENAGRVVTKTELAAEARKLKARGEPAAVHYMPPKNGNVNRLEGKTKPEREKIMKAINEQAKKEAMPENVMIRPLLPWMASALYSIIDDHYKKVTLEDLLVDISDMTKTQYEMVNQVAQRMNMRVSISRKFEKKNAPPLQCQLRRNFTARDMLIMLQLHNGTSGRYYLKSLKNPTPQNELQAYKDEQLAAHAKLVEARNNPDDLINSTATNKHLLF